MPAPTYAQLVNLSQPGPGYNAESIEERILTVLAMLASGTAPDGSPLPPGAGGVGIPLILNNTNPAVTPLQVNGAVGQSTAIVNIIAPGADSVTVDGAGNLNVLGASPTLTLNGAGAASPAIYWNVNNTSAWLLYMSGGGATMYLRDMAHARMHMLINPGATAAAASTEISSTVQIDSLPAFVAGDHYVVADATGHLHLSSLGPAS